MVAPYTFEVGSEWPEWDKGNFLAMRFIQKCINDGFARKELSLAGKPHQGDAPPFRMDDPLVPTPANKTCTFFVQLEPVDDEERNCVTASNLEHNHRLELKRHCFEHLHAEEGAVIDECREAIKKLAFEQAERLRKRFDNWFPTEPKAVLFEIQDQLIQDYGAAFSRKEAEAFVVGLKHKRLYLEEPETDFSPTPSPTPSPTSTPVARKRELPELDGPASSAKKRRQTQAGDEVDKPTGNKQEGKKASGSQARKGKKKPVQKAGECEPRDKGKGKQAAPPTFADFLSSLSESFDFSRYEPHFAALDITSEAQLLEVATGGADELGALLDELEKEVNLPDGTKLSGMKKPWRSRLKKLLDEQAEA
ncbi:hypothetical protein JCM10049v2_004343 [Rhodotorula toruloides]